MNFLQGKSLLYKGNEVVSAETALKKKILILYYFTTDNNDSCRDFDLKLKTVYQEALRRKIEIAVIVVSCDTNIDSFNNNLQSNYFEWYNIRFEDDLIHTLILNYGVTHVPSLVVVTKNGTLVTKKGVKDIEEIGINVLVIWT